MFLKQSTAAQTRTIGPFVDDTDFKTLENALTINNTDILLKKNGGASAAKNSGGATADGAGGFYHLTFDATDTATVGELAGSVKVAGALVVPFKFFVLEEVVYDALFAASAAGYGTAQTGDAFARLGAPAGASVSADVAAVKTQTAAIETDTQDLQSRTPAALVSGRMSADIAGVNGSTTGIASLSAHLPSVLRGLTTSGSTTTAIVMNATTGIDGGAPSATNDFYNGRTIVFTSGALAGQATSISDYVGATQTLTVAALTGAPASGVTFVIV